MPYNHGVRVSERTAETAAPLTATSGLQVVFGTAPINRAADPYHVTNVPILAHTYDEAVAQLGYSDDFAKYTLCESMFASFKLYNVAPVVFVNVLDPATHKTTNAEASFAVNSLHALYNKPGVLLDTVVVKNGETALTKDTDYILAFNADGYVDVTLLATGSAASAESLNISSTSIDPTAVTASDIIGSATNGDKGLECIRQVFPRFGMTPGLIIAPGWSQNSDVAAVIAAKCEEINGYYTCEAFVDINSGVGACRSYSSVQSAKNTAGISSPHVMAIWPCVENGTRRFWASSHWGALTAYTDAVNDNVPSLSPDNRVLKITGTCLADGTPVLLDQVQANTVNGAGVSTALHLNGWRSWGSNSAAYPAPSGVTLSSKDRWFSSRRFFSWWANRFILEYSGKVGLSTDYRLIESIVDAENIRGNAYVSAGKCAAAYIEFNEEENSVENLLNGKLTFHQHLAPYTPAEDILNILEFDPAALAEALSGGEQ